MAFAPPGFCRGALHALWTDVSISFGNVMRHGRRSLAGSVAVAFGAIALITAAGFIEWIYFAMREGTIYAGLGHIQVMRPGFLERGSADPFGYLLPDHAAERALLERAPGVKSVAPQLRFTGLISFGDASLSFLGKGLDTTKEIGGQHATRVESGAALTDDEAAGIVLGKGLASNLGAKVGDKVVLLVNKRGNALGGIEAAVRGTFSTPTQAYDEVAVHVPLRLADGMLEARGAHTWVVYLHDTAQTPAVLQALRGQLGAQYQLVPWYEAADFYNKTVRLFSRQVLVMKIIIALVVVLSISNTMLMSVIERTSEIATAMALGVRRRRILSRFVAEGCFIGLIGALAGVVLGYLFARIISEVGIPMPPPPGMARAYMGEILVTPGLARDAVLLAVLTALLASIYPAWKASRMVIADALRHGR